MYIMKTRHFSVAAILLAGSLLASSCVGSFGLFNKLATWNKSATSSKFLNEILFIVISPAYAVCSVADLFIFNTIEFWSGNNPMAQNVGKTIDVMGQDGKYYAVKILSDGYEIKTPTGEMVAFVYDKATDSWSQVQDGKTVEMFRFNADGTIKVQVNGESMDVALNEAGVYQVSEAAGKGMFWALR